MRDTRRGHPTARQARVIAIVQGGAHYTGGWTRTAEAFTDQAYQERLAAALTRTIPTHTWVTDPSWGLVTASRRVATEAGPVQGTVTTPDVLAAMDRDRVLLRCRLPVYAYGDLAHLQLCRAIWGPDVHYPGPQRIRQLDAPF